VGIMFLLRCVVELAQWVADLPWVVDDEPSIWRSDKKSFANIVLFHCGAAKGHSQWD
jgi:hypothetical protein